jgi:L-lactate dehydrogenase
VPQANAHYIAETIVHAEAFGITTHGLTQLRYLDSQIGSSIDPKAEPKVVKEAGATALIDGDGTFGQLAMRLAQQLAVEKAKTHGAAWIGVAKTAWIGAVGIYLIRLARAGFLAQLWAQNCACQDSPPIGGIDPRFSTNPIALAFPTGADPVLADFSTSAVSMGRVSRLVKAGKKADAPIFMDNQGTITDDPAAVVDAQGHRQGGSILFMGGQDQGHKGYALSLWCEALTALVGGDCNNPDAPQRQCFTLTVLDPDAFAGREYFTKEMKRFIAWVKSARRQKGIEEIRLPGERGFRAIRQAEQRGLPLDDAALAQLNALAQKNGLEPVKTA